MTCTGVPCQCFSRTRPTRHTWTLSTRQALRGNTAPTGVLRHRNTALDDRLPVWESPNFMVELTCGYEVRSRAGGWEALRLARNACERKVPLGERHIQPGETLRVPAPRDPTSMVVASFDQPTSSFDRLLRAGPQAAASRRCAHQRSEPSVHLRHGDSAAPLAGSHNGRRSTPRERRYGHPNAWIHRNKRSSDRPLLRDTDA